MEVTSNFLLFCILLRFPLISTFLTYHTLRGEPEPRNPVQNEYPRLMVWIAVEWHLRQIIKIKYGRALLKLSLEEVFRPMLYIAWYWLQYIYMQKIWEYTLKYIPIWKSLLQPNAHKSLITCFLWFNYTNYLLFVNPELLFDLFLDLFKLRCAIR